MSLRNTLNLLMRAVIDEAERNPEFEAALNEVLNSPPSRRKRTQAGNQDQGDVSGARRGKNRRAPAALDPVQIVRDGEQALRIALENLTLEQLRDIVAEHGMDPGRLVMKWNTSDRVIDRIVEISIARAHKGNAFRRVSDEPPSPVQDADE